MGAAIKTFVYIDGFNLYYSAVKRCGQRWIDLRQFVERSFPSNTIEHVFFFTSKVMKTDEDPTRHKRHQALIDALEATGVRVVRGKFSRNKNWLPAVGGGYARVWKAQEKNSDVNLASFLLMDAIAENYDAAIVLTNDSDLATPIHLVRSRLKKPVVVLAPVMRDEHVNLELRKAASKCVVYDQGLFEACSLSDPVIGPDGPIHKPATW